MTKEGGINVSVYTHLYLLAIHLPIYIYLCFFPELLHLSM